MVEVSSISASTTRMKKIITSGPMDLTSITITGSMVSQIMEAGGVKKTVSTLDSESKQLIIPPMSALVGEVRFHSLPIIISTFKFMTVT